jgi:AraC-like DNA-binding protein
MPAPSVALNAGDGFAFQTAPPSPELRPWVAYYWLLQVSSEASARGPAELLIPDGYDELVFSYEGPFERGVLGGSRSVRAGSYAVVGRADSVTARCLGSVKMVGIKLLPATWQRLTQVPGAELPAGLLPLGALHDRGLALLERRLSEASSLAGIALLCDRFLAQRLARHAGDPLLERAVRLVFAERGVERIRPLSGLLGLHPRTLEKRAKHTLGLSLKTLARIVRFKHGYHWSRLGQACVLPWYDSGYYDQSHFIRDFRRVTGLSPSALPRVRADLSTAVIDESLQRDVAPPDESLAPRIVLPVRGATRDGG